MTTMAKLLIAAGILTAGTVSADPVTYEYTGVDFTMVAGGYTTSESVTGTFTLAAPLAAGTTTTINPNSANFVGYAFSDGTQTISSANAGTVIVDGATFTTNSAGAIIGYTLNLYGASIVGPGVGAPEIEVCGGTVLSGGGCTYAELGTTDEQTAYGIGSEGSLAAVPLPASAWLMLSGVAGLGAMVRRRRV